MCKTENTCICLPEWDKNDSPLPFPLNPVLSTPLDKLGFAWKCCWCIPLKVACILICIISFLWATIEMTSAHKTMSKLFEDKDQLYWAKLIYTLFTFSMFIASGLLMLGIIMSNYKILNYYVWHALIFNCIYIGIYMTGVALDVAKSGSISAKRAFKMLIVIFWNFLFFYFIIVVNSYKIMLWE